MQQGLYGAHGQFVTGDGDYSHGGLDRNHIGGQCAPPFLRKQTPVPFEGINIVGHVAEGSKDVERTLYWRKPRGETVWSGVRQGSLKYVSKREGDRQEAYLFDLADDISESRDLRDKQPQAFERLRQLYTEWEQRTRRNRRGRP